MKLSELAPPKGAKKNRKRRGRGPGTGQGTFGGRGCKGQRARSGGRVRPGFEGGQMPLHRRLPKRGFLNPFKKVYAVINLRDLAGFEAGAEVTEAALRERGLVSGKVDGVKVLGHGDISVKLSVKAEKWSKTAQEKIVQAGGTIEAP
ncbi:MAG: 50S ribosomal protein L15 [Thermodesulfobacteriota bacterium]